MKITQKNNERKTVEEKTDEGSWQMLVYGKALTRQVTVNCAKGTSH